MFNFAWLPETLAVSLPIMLKGMIGIFAVILVIMLFVRVLTKVCGKKKEQ